MSRPTRTTSGAATGAADVVTFADPLVEGQSTFMGSGDAAVGMSESDGLADREAIEETLAILSDPVAMEQIRESEQALAAGEPAVPLADLRAQFQAGGPGLEPG